MELGTESMTQLLHNRAIEEYAARYEQQGYKVQREYKIGEYSVDLYAEKDGVRIALEFKTRLTHNMRERLDGIRHFAQEQGVQFRVVIVQIPQEKHIQIDGIGETLFNWFQNSMPDALDELSSHTMIDEVEDVVLTRVDIRSGGEMYIEGKGVVFVTLDYGVEEEDEEEASDSFPFTFKGIWGYDENKQLIIESLEYCDFDTSSFYE